MAWSDAVSSWRLDIADRDFRSSAATASTMLLLPDCVTAGRSPIMETLSKGDSGLTLQIQRSPLKDSCPSVEAFWSAL